MTELSTDAFGRLRTSETGQRLDVEFIYDKQPDFFDEITNSGTVTFNAITRDLTLSLANATNGSHATMRSHPVPYTPGNSQLIDITGVLDLANIGGGKAQVFLRSSVIGGTPLEQTIDQEDWDDLYQDDIEMDWSKAHIFSLDFQSLKVGKIRYYIVASGRPRRVASIANDNLRQSGYWQVASLAAYWRVYNDATYTYMEVGYGDENNAIGFRYRIEANASATMKAICCTVKSESGINLAVLPGIPRSVNMGVTSKAVGVSRIPLLSVRQKDLFEGYDNLSVAIPKSFTIQASNPVLVEILTDGTLTGESWTDVGAESSIEYDTTATAITGGRKVFSGYYTGASRNQAGSILGLLSKMVLWNRQSTETGILTIAATRSDSQNSNTLASLFWDEIR